MRIWTLIPLVTALACGSDGGSGGGQSAGEKACKDFEAKLTQCQLVASGTCDTNEPCVAECAAKADCTQLTENPPTGSYLSCVAACSGAGPDDFICKDGKAFVKKAGVCDGQFQCLDGSDEAGCSKDAGAG